MNRDSLISEWRREEQQPFSGWDFSYLEGRMMEGREPWSYLERAAELMGRSSSVIDMATGGGEKLLSLREHWPERVIATENYSSSFELATSRLAPLGVRVLKTPASDIALMPFRDDEVDLVLNRQAAFNSLEVARVLAVGGTFLTQQVHALWAWDLLAIFDSSPQFPDVTAARYVPELEADGLAIANVEEWEGRLAFSDVGAIVYYLKAVPWLMPRFSVETHLQYLFTLQERLDAGEKLEFYAAKFLIEARKS